MAPTVPVSREVMTKFIIAFVNENPNIPYGEFTETLLAAMKEKGLCTSETKLATIIDAMVGLANTSDEKATVPAVSETSTTSEAVDAPPVKAIKPPDLTPQNEVPQPVVETSGKEVNPSGITDRMINSVKIDAVINAAKDIQRDDKNNITWNGFYTVVYNHLKESNSDIPPKARAFVISELWSRYNKENNTEGGEKAALQTSINPAKAIKPPEVTPGGETPGKAIKHWVITDEMINSVKIIDVIKAAKEIESDDKGNITWRGFFKIFQNHLNEIKSDIPLNSRATVISALWSRYKEEKGAEDSEKAALQSVVQTSISPPDVTPGSETPVKAIKPPEVPFMTEIFDSEIYEHINKEVSKIIERCPGASNTEIQSTLREIQPPCAETSRALRKLSTFVLGKICDDARREYHRKKYNEPKGWPNIYHFWVEADGLDHSVVFSIGVEPVKACPHFASAKKVRITPMDHHSWVGIELLKDSSVETVQISGQPGIPVTANIYQYSSLKHLKNLKIGPYAECDGTIHFNLPMALKVFDVSELLDSPGDMSTVIAEKLVINVEQIRYFFEASYEETFKVVTVVVEVNEFDPIWNVTHPDAQAEWIGKRNIFMAEQAQTRMRTRNPSFRIVFQQRAKLFQKGAKGHYVVALDEILYRQSGSTDVF